MARGSLLSEWFGHPEIVIDGSGWISDIRLERNLELMRSTDEDLGDQPFDMVFVEDAAWILAGELRGRGYLEPSLSVRILDDSGGLMLSTQWTAERGFEPVLPERAVGQRLEFELKPGKLYWFREIEVLSPAGFVLVRTAEAYFFATDTLLQTRDERFFSDDRLNSGLARMIDELRDRGYPEARVGVEEISKDHDEGGVNLSVRIKPGPLCHVRRVEVRVRSFGEPVTVEVDETPGVLLSPRWLNSKSLALRQLYQEAGYADATVDTRVDTEIGEAGQSAANVVFDVNAGRLQRVAAIVLEGDPVTGEGRLRGQIEISTGDLVRPSELSQARDKIARLGVHDRIRVHQEQAGYGEKNVVFSMQPRERLKTGLIFGLGTFDVVRLGLEFQHNNLWGLAHRQHAELIQSLRATYADYRYTIPQAFGADLDLFTTLDFLRREQINFQRVEYGGSVGFQRLLREWNVNLSAEFELRSLAAEEITESFTEGSDSAFTTSVVVRANQRLIDNPVNPTRGHRLHLTGTLAAPQLGSQVAFQSLEYGASGHVPLLSSLILHGNLRQGVLTSAFGDQSELPINERFRLGGENAMRGYLDDEASPQNDSGTLVGGEVYTLAQLQLEQRIVKSLSVVAFFDGSFSASDLSDFPGSEFLTSVGGGVYVRTPIGPLRIEYGHNLNPRSVDRSGAFHFALGFPF